MGTVLTKQIADCKQSICVLHILKLMLHGMILTQVIILIVDLIKKLFRCVTGR